MISSDLRRALSFLAIVAFVPLISASTDEPFLDPDVVCISDDLEQEVRRRVLAATTVFAEASAEADSVNHLPEGNLTPVVSCGDGWCSVFVGTTRGFVPEVLLAPAPVPASPSARPAPAPRRTCCRICRAGKACGDSCIARNRTCRVGRGCACNG